MQTDKTRHTKPVAIRWLLLLLLVLAVGAGTWYWLEANPRSDVVDVDPHDGSTPELDEQGNVQKSLGESGKLYDTQNNEAFHIVVEDATYQPTCPSRLTDEQIEPNNQQFLVLNVQASLAEELPKELEIHEDEGFMPLMPENFEPYDHKGQAISGYDTEAAFECFSDEDLLPPFISVGETVAGLIVFDLSDNAGQVAYLINDEPGWVWNVEE